MSQYKKILAPVILFLAFVALSGCGGNETASPPDIFQVGEDQAPAIQLPEGGVLTQLSLPGEGEEGPSRYVYEELPEAGALASEYTTLLSQEENGFSVVDEKGVESTPPDFTQPEGGVSLAKSSSLDGRLFQIDVSWSPGECQVSVSTPEGSISSPVAAEPMTIRDAVEYLQRQSPDRLGLEEGSSMSDYVIYPKLGTVLVDGIACLELDLFQRNAADTLDIVASYLVSGDQQNLFRLDRTTASVEQL